MRRLRQKRRNIIRMSVGTEEVGLAGSANVPQNVSEPFSHFTAHEGDAPSAVEINVM
jgi:hypothetical protein